MEFKKLHNEIEPCDCIASAAEDTTTIFVRKINEPKIRERDFRSVWELGKAGNRIDCNAKCSAKGISISNVEDRNELIKVFKNSFSFAPGFHPVMCFFKLNDGAGMVKSTPSRNNKYHVDFYKCDNFSINNLTISEYLQLESA